MTRGWGIYISPSLHNPLDLHPLLFYNPFILFFSAIVFSPAAPFFNQSRTHLFRQLMNNWGY